MKNSTFREIGEELLLADKILLFPHINMDGDALGSTVALCLALRHLGKEAWVLSHEDVPKNLDFLECGCVTKNNDVVGTADLAVMVDCSTMNRIRHREAPFQKAGRRAVIDHHAVSEPDVAFDFGTIEPESAATGELVYLLLREMGCALDLDMANAIFAAITTDTGNYQHSNTTARSHEITAALYQVPGFNSKPVSSLIYDRNTFESLRLEGMMVDSIRLFYGGKVAVGRVTQEMLKETGCGLEETEGFVQRLMSISGVEAACFLKETANDSIRISLRSRAYANVAVIAQTFGGGGHVRAAGASAKPPMEAVEARLLELLGAEIAKGEDAL